MSALRNGSCWRRDCWGCDVSLLSDLAKQRCERETSRNGCIGNVDHPCNPCLARQELGLSPEAPRFCAACGVEVTNDGNGGFVGTDGSTTHPMLHVTQLFYDEYTSRK